MYTDNNNTSRKARPDGTQYTQSGSGGYNMPGYYERVGGYERREPPRRKKRNVAGLLITVALVAGLAGGGAGWFAASGALRCAGEGAQDSVNVEQQGVVQLSSTAGSSVDDIDESAANGTITAIADKTGGAVVEVTVESVVNQPLMGQAISEGRGSGVIFSSDGYIITNNHVVAGAQNIKVTLKDGNEYDAQLIGTDAQTDLAVIKVEAEGLPTVEFGDSDSLEVGELAVAIGNPLGQLGGTVTSGIISATARSINISGEQMTLIQTSAAVNPGNSGGGLFDKEGRLIGVVNAKLTGSEIEGLAFAIPANTVSEIINDIIKNGYVTGRPELGLEVVDVQDSATARSYGLNDMGVFVARSYEELGLVAADRIAKIEGAEVSSLAQLNELLEKCSVGDSVTLTIERGGETAEISITLSEQANEAAAQSGGGDFETV